MATNFTEHETLNKELSRLVTEFERATGERVYDVSVLPELELPIGITFNRDRVRAVVSVSPDRLKTLRSAA